MARSNTKTPRVRRVRWRRSVLLLALLTPSLIAGFAMGAIGTPSVNPQTGQPNLQAALVNEESTLYQVDLSGQSVPAPMGRLLVGQLVDDSTNGFSWTITDKADAQAGLAAGEYSAVVIIPSNFSEAYLSGFTANPRQAVLTVETDGSHSYLAAVLGRSLAKSLQSTMSSTMTEAFVGSLLVGYTVMSQGLDAIGQASGELTTGLDTIVSVTSLLPQATAELASGSRQVTSGVNGLADALGALGKWSQGAVDTSLAMDGNLATLSQWVTDNVSDPTQKQALLTQIETIQAQSGDLTVQTFESDLGIDLGAGGAWLLGQGSGLVTDGSQALADATPALPDAIAMASEGSAAITDILNAAAKTVPRYSADQTKQLAKVAAQPIETKLTTKPALPQAIGAIGALTIPVALWLGALVLAFIYAPYERRALATRASTRRIVWGSLAPTLVMAGIQTGLVLLSIFALNLGPIHNLGLVGLMVLSSLSFVILHQGMAAVFDRFAWLVSVALLSLQVVASGVLLPQGYLPDWVVSAGAILPLSQSIQGAQELISSGSIPQALGSAVWLVVAAVVGVILNVIGVARGRNLRSRLVAI